MTSVSKPEKLKVLLITLEFRTWANASHWPYSMNLGFEEGLDANGIEFLTIPAMHEVPSSASTSWLSRAREICAGKQFDQVWFEISHSNLDQVFLEWLTKIAPIRIGFIVESLDMDPREWLYNPEGARRRQKALDDRLPYITHVIAVDEADVDKFNTHGPVPAMWVPGMMPERFICEQPPPPSINSGVFFGALYGERKKWLDHTALKGLLVRPDASPEWATDLPRHFDELNFNAEQFLKSGAPVTDDIFSGYMDLLRHIRSECFSLWLQGLQRGCAVVNLPQLGKMYASRVFEGIAAGRPVITVEIPERPKTKTLFEDGKEILLYKQNDPLQLAEHIEHILREPEFGRQIAANASRKLKELHTIEELVRQILTWVENQETSPSLLQDDQIKADQLQGTKVFSMKNFYGPGDTVFDVGAHIGAKTDIFLANGAKVICFEPQPDCAKVLRNKYAGNEGVLIVEKGLADKHGKMQLSICSQASTISTFSDEWKKGRFADYKWDRSVMVEVITLDEAIQTYRNPQYVKIDVEGFEYQVLRGLSKPVPLLSFEFAIEFLDSAKQCVSLLEKLGYKLFNLAEGETPQLALSEWVSSQTLFEYIERSADPLLWGDIYAKFDLKDHRRQTKKTQEAMDQLPFQSSLQGLKKVETLSTNTNPIEQFRTAGLWSEGQPLRLHLGCGEQHFDGYVNIDYPPSEHNVMQIKADIYANIAELDFPPGSVDEVRLHHVFEHFSRVTALAMLIRWHQWLKIGGKLWIETPDLIGSAKTLLSNAAWRIKTAAVRHLAGDQAASWAYHVDHWFPERFEHTLRKFGFDPVQTQSVSWQHEPYLSNVHAVALKAHELTLDELLRAAEELLWESTVSETERPTYEVWKAQLKSVLAGKFIPPPSNAQSPDISSISQAPTALSQTASKLPLPEIHDFNQRSRDRWVQAKAKTVPPGSRVLDIGAGTCPYKKLFAHCDYKTHDFKKYEGEKLGGTTEYGNIDYEADIINIPVPDSSFDIVLCTEVLEHVQEPIEAIRKMSRILQPGGRLFLTAPLGSGLHQLPYHFYGGFTPEWYKHFLPKFSLKVLEITPNGGFFKLLAQECARVAWTFGSHKHLHGEHADFVHQLFNELLPRYLFALDEKCFIDQFTVGYHVEAIKLPPEANVSEEAHLLEDLQKDFRNVRVLIRLAEIELQRTNPQKAHNYLIGALVLEPQNEVAKVLLEKLQKGEGFE